MVGKSVFYHAIRADCSDICHSYHVYIATLAHSSVILLHFRTFFVSISENTQSSKTCVPVCIHLSLFFQVWYTFVPSLIGEGGIDYLLLDDTPLSNSSTGELLHISNLHPNSPAMYMDQSHSHPISVS